MTARKAGGVHELAVLTATLLACRTAGSDAPGGVAAVDGAETPARTREAVREPIEAALRCTPSLPDPPAGGPAAEGPAYVVVDGVGVLRIADDGVSTVLARADGSSWDPEVALGPTGELWVSDWSGVSVIASDGKVRTLPLARDGWRPERLAVRSATDVWAVTSDSEWSVLRFDGKQWAMVRPRAKFPGMFDDNKIDGLVATSDAVWVSTWNGLWRGVGAEWRRIDPPEGVDGPAELWVYRDQVIAGYIGEHFLREGETWRALGWPSDVSLRRAVGNVGLAAAPRLDGPTVLLGPVEGGGCIATSDAIHGSRVHALAIDGSGRTWLATEEALAVVDGSGRALAEWTLGTLPGLTGRIRGVAVAGAGPQRLPAVGAARTWEVVGRLETHKRGTPLGGTAIELCSASSASGGCVRTSFFWATTTAADGSFRFVDVPEGSFRLVVHPSADVEECQGIFSESGHSIAPARDCHGTASAPSRCDLGTLTECLPFEMPPPP